MQGRSGTSAATHAGGGSDNDRTAVAATGNTWLVVGVVTHEMGEDTVPIRDAVVQVTLERGETRVELARGTTDAEGRLEINLDKLKTFPALARIHGKLWVGAWADGFEFYEEDIHHLPRTTTEPFRRELEFDLEQGSVVTGRVLDANYKPVYLAMVDVADEYQQTDETGRYRVEMRAPGIKPLVRELDLRAGKITLLKGQLEAAK